MYEKFFNIMSKKMGLLIINYPVKFIVLAHWYHFDSIFKCLKTTFEESLQKKVHVLADISLPESLLPNIRPQNCIGL